MAKTKEKLNTMIVPLKLNDEQYAQICAKADHDNVKPEDIVQEAVELFLHQINGEKVVLNVDLMIQAFDIYNEAGMTSDSLRSFCEKNKF